MSRYEVHVRAVPAERERVVRAFRVLGRMSLEKALGVYEYAREHGEIVVAAGLRREVAEHVVAQLEAGRIEARIRESAVAFPMVLDPEVETPYAWGPMRTLRRISNG